MENIDLTKKLYTALKLAEEKLAGFEQQQTEPIAIIGMAGRFPDADNIEQFWDNLYKGHDPVREIPADRWNADLFYDEDPDSPGKTYCQSGAFLKDIKGFDAAFFNILPAEAKQMAPQQRVLLETAWQALEAANIRPSQLSGSNTAVYMGISDDDYSYITSGDRGKTINPHSVTGHSLSSASGRLSYFMGLQGANMVVQTACSSSLAAVDLGIQELRLKKTDLVLAGGVNHILLPFGHIALSRTHAISADGRCKSFDASADGYGRGEGCGIVVLKRYSDALKDGDHIFALIKGSAINQDGLSNGMTAPNGTAQERVILKSLQNANIEASEISFVEAHGTGTKLGDPIEIEVLGKVYGKNRPANHPLYVSTVKTNIGHLEAAAGIASLIKTTLALYHKTIPPNLHFKQSNNAVTWHASIRIATNPVSIENTEKPVTAAISSFGFSGTNVHMILESAQIVADQPVADNGQPVVLLLSAKDTPSLNLLIEAYQNYLTNTTNSLTDICHTAALYRDHFAVRTAMIATDKADLINLLSGYNTANSTNVLVSPFVNSKNSADLISIAGKYVNGNNAILLSDHFNGKRVSIPVYQFHHLDMWVYSAAYLALINGADEVEKIQSELISDSAKLPFPEDTIPYLYRVLEEITELPAGKIKTDDDFFSMGMDSILIIQLKQRINTDRATNIEVSLFYNELNTFNKLANYLAQHQGGQQNAPANADAPHHLSTHQRSAAKVFIPYKEVNLLQESLDGIKEKALQKLITDVNTISNSSKTHTQLYRSWLANNRNIAGFRPRWKEMTYQLVAAKGNKAHIWDKDGNRFLDFSMGFGVNLFGYNPEFVQQSLHQVIDDQLVLGALAPAAGELAEAICTVTGNERAAFYNTGTEAVMVAIRLARAITGKNKIVLFAGSYHGTYDGILAREGTEIYAEPLAPGIAPSMVQDVIVLHYGSDEDLDIIRDLAPDLAAVLVEPVQSRHPDIFPVNFLKELEVITKQHEIALIFDEVISGFRFSINGIRSFTDVKADITVYGKIIGGGIPVGVVAGRARFLDAVDGGFWNYGDQSYPSSKSTFVAGTFCHHPLAMAAGLSVINHLKQHPDLYQKLNDTAHYLCTHLNNWFTDNLLNIRMIHFGSLFRFALKGNEELLFYKLLAKGIYIWEGRNCYLSTVHTSDDIELLIASVKESCLELINEGWISQVEIMEPSAQTDENILTLSPAQRGVWWAQQLSDDTSTFNLSESFLVTGPFNKTVFEQACCAIIAQHEILRTSFAENEGVPFQKVHERFAFTIKQFSLKHLDEQDAINEALKILERKIREPFNLEEAPLLNIMVYEVGENKLVLTIVAHHIICDGWALEVLFDEVIDTYNSLLNNTKATNRAPASLQYRHYINHTLEPAHLQQLQHYWHQQVNGINTLTLNGDISNANTGNEAFDEILIDGETYASLSSIVKNNHVSPFTVLSAVTKLLLYTYTGQNDIAIGTPVPGRVQTKWNKLIGLCLNMLVLRSKINTADTFAAYLQQLQALILNAYEKQEYSFELLRSECSGDRLPNEMPFFEIEIAMQNFRMHRHNKGRNFAGIQIEAFADLSLDSRKYPIEFRFDEGYEDVLLKVAYDPGRYSSDFIKTLLNDWQQLYQLVTQSASISINDIVTSLQHKKAQSQQSSLKNNRQNNLSKLISTSN